MQLILAAVTAIAFAAAPAFASITTGSADLVLGQIDFTNNLPNSPDAQKMQLPSAVAVDKASGRVFVSDANSQRILFWNNASALVNGQKADGVIGQADFFSYGVSTGPQLAQATNLLGPTGIAIDQSGSDVTPLI